MKRSILPRRIVTLIVSILLALCATAAQAVVPASERAALLDIYASTNGGGWTNSTGWNGAPGTECTWYGVSCDFAETMVQNISLQSNNLSGTLPASLNALTNLATFYAPNNNLTGSIPTLTGPIMTSFTARFNKLTGSIPALSGLPNLWGYDVQNNNLSGSIPALAGLTNLIGFWAHNNNLSGSIPSLAGLTNLLFFQVGSNSLTGVVPSVPSPSALLAGGSTLCPNTLNPTPDTAWDTATGITPWYSNCTPVTYTLTYSAGANGSISGASPQTVNSGGSGSAVTALPATGYYFVNWSDGSTANPRTDSNVTGNITVNANFAIDSVVTYTLTYTAGANGSISGISPQTVNSGSSGSAVTALPATGYHFVNWSDGSTVNPRTDTNVTSNITVSASFAIKTYTLTYTAGANGSISGTSPQTVNSGSSGSAVTALPATGYYFVNWSDGSTVNPRTDSNVTSNVTVSASFAIHTNTVTFDSNGGSVVSSQNVNYNSTATQPAAPTRTGYTFTGWYSDPGLTSAFNFSTLITSSITLYAKWTLIPTYTVTYNGNTNTSGSVPVDGATYVSGATVTVLGNTGALVKPGYNFAGWNTAANGSGTAYAAAASFVMGAGNVTLYAQWTTKPFIPLTGTVAASPKPGTVDSTMLFIGSVSNQNEIDLSGVPLTLTVKNANTQAVVQQWNFSANIANGNSFNLAQNWSTNGVSPGDYVVLLGATAGGQTTTLAQDSFKLILPIKLDIKQTLSNANRVLVLVSCNDGESEVISSDGKPPVCVTTRTQTIDQALFALGVTHTITTNEAAFRLAFRSGIYNTYWISGKEDKLHDDLAAEIREAVYAGDGLILDGLHDQRNKTLDSVAGLTSRGKIGETNLSVDISGALFTAQTLPTLGRALKIDLNGGVQQAAFHGSQPSSTGPAIISNTYGAGHAMTFAFDLPISLQAQANWQPILGAGLQALLPTQSTTLTPDGLLSIKTSITNQGRATDVIVKIVLPPGADYLSLNPTGSYDAGTRTFTWTFSLAEAQTKDLFLLLQAPSTAGSTSLQTTVATVSNGVTTPYGAPLTLPINVVAAVQSSIDAVTALQALPLTQSKDRKLRDALVAELQDAMSNFNKNTVSGYQTAISDLLDIADRLSGLGTADTSAVRLGIDRILREAEWRWVLAQP